MKYIVIIMFLVSIVYSNCDYTNIKENDDGSYTYSEELHICVGDMKNENENLNKTIELKDLVIDKTEERVELWKEKSFELEKELTTMERIKEMNKWVYYGLGVITVGLSVYLAGQVYK